MKMYVGLGNPGKEYEGTRHNMGFRALDRFADLAGAVFDRQGFKGVYGVVRNPAFAEPIIILKPQTFMNLSGASVRPLAD
jgi:PTH1 family peptidyl-tRNA hydrolase